MQEAVRTKDLGAVVRFYYLDNGLRLKGERDKEHEIALMREARARDTATARVAAGVAGGGRSGGGGLGGGGPRGGGSTGGGWGGGAATETEFEDVEMGEEEEMHQGLRGDASPVPVVASDSRPARFGKGTSGSASVARSVEEQAQGKQGLK